MSAYVLFLVGLAGLLVAGHLLVRFAVPITVLTMATILLRGRPGIRRRARSGTRTYHPINVSASPPRTTPSAIVSTRSQPKEVRTWTPSHTNPLLLLRAPRNDFSASGRRG